MNGAVFAGFLEVFGGNELEQASLNHFEFPLY
jgi:hypothetical protein